MNKKLIFASVLLTLLVLAAGGIVFVMRTTKPEALPGILNNLFPSGSQDVVTTQTTSGDTATNLTNKDLQDGAPAPTLLRKLTATPTTQGVVTTKKGQDVIRYMERETGHIFEVAATSTHMQRLTNTTIPRVQETLWSPDGDYVVLRYLKNGTASIETFLGHINEEEEGGALVGEFLPPNIVSIAAHPTENRFVYIYERAGIYQGTSIEAATGETVVLFRHPLGEWVVAYTAEGSVLLTSTPSATTPGFLYKTTGQELLARIIGNIFGLTTLMNASGSYVLYAESGVSSFSTHAQDTSSEVALELSPRTLPEKCVWSTQEPTTAYCFAPKTIPPGAYPDVWYQGLVSFNDSLWELNVETGSSHMIIDLEQVAQEPIDAYLPTLSDSETTLVFLNKKDSSLWSLVLEPKTVGTE